MLRIDWKFNSRTAGSFFDSAVFNFAWPPKQTLADRSPRRTSIRNSSLLIDFSSFLGSRWIPQQHQAWRFGARLNRLPDQKVLFRSRKSPWLPQCTLACSGWNSCNEIVADKWRAAGRGKGWCHRISRTQIPLPTCRNSICISPTRTCTNSSAQRKSV